jgi:anti-anti-sigma regulatory factor
MEQGRTDFAMDTTPLRLDPSLRIEEVESRRDLLLERLRGPGPVMIDVSGLESVDTAGVQLLLACRREAARRGVQLEYCGESPALTDALQRLGLVEAVLGRRT